MDIAFLRNHKIIRHEDILFHSVRSQAVTWHGVMKKRASVSASAGASRLSGCGQRDDYYWLVETADMARNQSLRHERYVACAQKYCSIKTLQTTEITN